jgi:hypothetical protein
LNDLGEKGGERMKLVVIRVDLRHTFWDPQMLAGGLVGCTCEECRVSRTNKQRDLNLPKAKVILYLIYHGNILFDACFIAKFIVSS